MNRVDPIFAFKGEARIKYLDGEFQVLAPGDFVKCAVSGKPIPLSDLRYWNVARQEAYASALDSLKRHLEMQDQKD